MSRQTGESSVFLVSYLTSTMAVEMKIIIVLFPVSRSNRESERADNACFVLFYSRLSTIQRQHVGISTFSTFSYGTLKQETAVYRT